jgi:hypothetical protein
VTLVSALRPRALTVDDQRQVDRIHLKHTASVIVSAGNDALALDDRVGLLTVGGSTLVTACDAGRALH